MGVGRKLVRQFCAHHSHIGNDTSDMQTTTPLSSLTNPCSTQKIKSSCKDMTGHQVGKLTVLYYHHGDKSGAHWLCRCECGNTTVIAGGNLRKGETKSCGCHKASIFVDMTGEKIGRLTVKYHHHSNKAGAFWLCECKCGNEAILLGHALRDQKGTRSCGCLLRDGGADHGNFVHGLIHSDEYCSWQSMKARCDNPKEEHFDDYGGRGITYHPRWHSFENFYEDMGPKPGAKYTLDRIDVNGNYEPSNCRWADWKTQGRNKRNTKRYTIDGQTKTLGEWCDLHETTYQLVWNRVRANWDLKIALTTPKLPNNRMRPRTA